MTAATRPSCARCGAPKRPWQRWYTVITPSDETLHYCDHECLLRAREAFAAAVWAEIRGDRLVCADCQRLVDDVREAGDGRLVCSDCDEVPR